MATAESAKKVCVVCGADVAGKPRVKDAAGRYMCTGECQQKAVEAAKQAVAKAASRPAAPPVAPQKPAPGQAAAAAGGDGLLGKLISDSPMLNAARCEACGSAMPGGAVVCTRCGFNTQTGKSLKTAVIVEKEKKEATPKAAGYSNPYGGGMADFGPSFGVLFLIVAGGIGAIAALGFVNPLFIALAFVLAGIVHLAGFIWGFVDAIRQGDTMYAVVGFFIGIVFLYYMLAVSESKWGKALYLGSLVGIIIAAAILFGALGGDLESLANGKLGG